MRTSAVTTLPSSERGQGAPFRGVNRPKNPCPPRIVKRIVVPLWCTCGALQPDRHAADTGSSIGLA